MADWKYYNHALISTLAPHITPDITTLVDKKTWLLGGGRCSPAGQRILIVRKKLRGGM